VATDLTNEVTLQYNGVQFPVYTNSRVGCRPVYDSAERTVVAVIYTLTADAVFSADGAGYDVGEDVLTLRQALTKPGGDLYYRDNGFGTFEVNALNADCKWGPKPRILSWEPRGLENTVKVSWQVEACLAECERGSTGIPIGKPRPPMEYCYQVSYGLDASGYQTITYSGHVVVATTRRSVSDRTITDQADRLREQITPETPPRFKVGTRNFTLSEDKTRLNFTITFEQLPPNVPPPGVVRVTASHSMSTSPIAAAQWDGTISATYEMAYHVPRNQCLEHFLALVRDRLNHTSLQGGNIRRVNAQGLAAAAMNARANMFGVIVPTRMQITENIYEKEAASLSLSYKATLPPGEIRRAIEVLGFFRPPPGAGDWRAWSASLSGAGRPHHPRGVAGSRFDPSQDRIIDLCLQAGGGDPIPLFAKGNGVLAPPGFEPIAANQLLAKINAFGGELRPEQAWLDFQNHVRVEVDDPVAEQPLLPTGEVGRLPPAAGQGNAAGAGFRVAYRDAPKSLIQLRGKPGIAVILTGQATRAGYSISPPEISRVGGVEAVPANRQGVEYFEQGVVGNLIYPICVARWRQRYILPEVPKLGIPVLENPMYGAVISENVVQIKGGLGRA